MDIIKYTALLILIISYLTGLFSTLRDIILLLIPAIKCRKVKNCVKDDCPFRSGCNHISYSPAEKERIRKLIDRL